MTDFLDRRVHDEAATKQHYQRMAGKRAVEQSAKIEREQFVLKQVDGVNHHIEQHDAQRYCQTDTDLADALALLGRCPL